MGNKKQIFCQKCKKRPVWNIKEEGKNKVCKRCYHKEWKVNKTISKEKIGDYIEAFDFFTCVLCQNDCEKTLFDNDKKICCLCAKEDELCNSCELREEEVNEENVLGNFGLVFNTIVESNDNRSDIDLFKKYYKTYWELSSELRNTYELEPKYYFRKKKEKRQIMNQKRKRRSGLIKDRIRVLEKIINLQVNNINDFLVLLLNDENYKIQRVVFRELGKINHPGILEYLIMNVWSEEYGPNWEIFEILKSYGPEALKRVVDLCLDIYDEFLFNDFTDKILLEILLITKDERIIDQLIGYILEADKSNEELITKIRQCVEAYGEKFWEEVNRIELSEGEKLDNFNFTEELRELLL